jgi:hypothetical protein
MCCTVAGLLTDGKGYQLDVWWTSICLSLSLSLSLCTALQSSNSVRKRKKKQEPGGEGTVDVIQSRLERERENERLSVSVSELLRVHLKNDRVCSTSLSLSHSYNTEKDVVIMHAGASG